MNMTDYISQFSSLNTARIAGKDAPHKAVLLLTIMELVQAGVINSTRIDLTEELEERFSLIWKKYVGTSLLFQPKVSTPFWHLVSEPFYRLYISSGQEIKGGSGRYSVKWLRKNTYAVIDEQLLQLMQHEETRTALKDVLISTYIQGLRLGAEGKALLYIVFAIVGMMIHNAA